MLTASRLREISEQANYEREEKFGKEFTNWFENEIQPTLTSAAERGERRIEIATYGRFAGKVDLVTRYLYDQGFTTLSGRKGKLGIVFDIRW